jgi:hypothetical protein
MTVDATGQHPSNQGPFVRDADSAHVLSVEKSCPDRSGILAESGQENLRWIPNVGRIEMFTEMTFDR